jgi:uncharacterized SAM-binding protein YcdF (DUF218 family)
MVQIAILLVLYDLAASFAYLYLAVSMNPELPAARWEAAVILFSDFDVNGNIDEETLRRLNATLDLYRREAVPLIVCSGGARRWAYRDGSAAMRQYLIERGLPDDKVLAEGLSNHTRRNLRESEHVLRRMNLSRAVVISSPVHLPRLRHLVSGQSGIAFDLAAYRLRDGEPSVSWVSLYGQIHHEFAAWLVDILLPDETMDSWVDRIRN